MNTREILDRIDALPPIPAVALKLLDASQDPDVDLGTVASWLERDPGMTANILRVCNSPFYGLRREISSVRQATGLLGLKKVVQIAVTMLCSRYLTPPQAGYGLGSGDLWKNSVASAIAAELVAQTVRYPHPSTAYTAGLLQDVGKIVLADLVGNEIAEIRHRVETDALDWEAAERRAVGLPHPEVGAMLLERWGFPPPLVTSVRFHHNPSKAGEGAELARLSHVADALTLTAGVGLGADGLDYALDEQAVADLGLADRGRLETLVETFAERLSKAQDLMEFPGTC